jgi:hypothetical protein
VIHFEVGDDVENEYKRLVEMVDVFATIFFIVGEVEEDLLKIVIRRTNQVDNL